MGQQESELEEGRAGPAAIEQLLERVCRQVVEGMGVTSCVLSRWDRAEGVVTTWVSHVHSLDPKQPLVTTIGKSFSLEDYPATARVLRERTVVAVRVDDPQADPAERALLEQEGNQSLLMLPLITEDQVIGLLEILQRDRPRVFTSEEIALAQALASQVAITIENAQLLAEQKRRITEISVVNEISRALSSSSLALDDLLGMVRQQVSRIFDTTNFFVALYEEGSDAWEMAFQIERGRREPSRRVQVGAGVTGHIIRTRQPVLLHSEAEADAFDEAQGVPLLGEQAKSWLGVPLIAANKLVGVMAIQSYEEENLYDEQDLDLFSTIAGQVAGAIDNARLLQESRRRAREMEVINEVGQAITSVLDLDDLLQEIVDIAKIRFGHYFVCLGLVEGDQVVFQCGSTIGDSDRQLEFAQVAVDLSHGPSLVAEAARTGRPVLVNDVLSDPRYLPVEELADTRAELDVPIKFKGQVIGILDVQSDQVYAYDEEDVALLEALTSQAGVAIENARVHREQERRIAEMDILNQISRALSSALELDELLEMVHQQVGRIFDATSFYVATYEEGSDEWDLRFAVEKGERAPRERYSTAAGLTGHIIRNRKPLLLRNPAEYSAFHQQQGIEFLGEPARSWLGVPLIAADKLVGVMTIQSYEEENLYDEQALALFSTIAAQAAIAVDNARFFEESQRRSEDLGALIQVGTAIVSTLDVGQVLEAVCREAVYMLHATSAYLVQWDDEQKTSTVIAEYYGPEASERERVSDLGVVYQEDLLDSRLYTGQPFVVRVSDPELASAEREALTKYGGKSALRLPLIARGRVLGYIEVWETRYDRPFSEDEILLGQSLASQAAIAIENARLFQESERRIAEQTILNEIGRALSSTLGLDEMLEAIHQQVGRIFVADNFYIALYEQGSDDWELRFEMDRGERTPVQRFELGAGLTGHIIRTGQPILLRTLEECIVFDEVEEIPLLGDQSKSWLGVPLIAADKVVGVMAIQSYEQENAYDEQDLSLFSTIASQAAVAIENARLFSLTQQRVAELDMLRDIGRALSSTLDVDELLEVIHQQVQRVLDADNLYIALYDEAENEVHFALSMSEGERQPGGRRKAGRGLTEHVIRTREALFLRGDVTAQAQAVGVAPVGPASQIWLGAPMIYGEQVLGMLSVRHYQDPDAYDESQLGLLQAVANQAAIALHNARLYAQVQEQLDELRQAGEIQSRLLEQVREMSTPVIPVHDRVLVLPLIGVVDTERARQFTERLLLTVRDQRARVVLLDITGVPVVDTAVAQALLQAAEATRLLGAEVVLVGIRSEVAQTLVTLGLSLEGLVTKANLQAGIEYALRQVGRRVVSEEGT